MKEFLTSEAGKDFLHRHPRMEIGCRLDKKHVIVDKADWETGVAILNNVRIMMKETSDIDPEFVKIVNEHFEELLCECGGNERIALDCTMKHCKY